MKQHLPDLLITTGVILISFGAWLIWPPAGIITGGSFMIAAGILIARGN